MPENHPHTRARARVERRSENRPVLTEDELSYLAGFFDGEGSIYARYAGGWPQNGMNVSNTDLDSLERFQRAFGGGISAKPPRGNRQPSWQWSATGSNLRVALAALQPYLQVKRQQADLVLLWESLPRDQRKEGFPELREKLQELNRRGNSEYRAPSFWVTLLGLLAATALLKALPLLDRLYPVFERFRAWGYTARRVGWIVYHHLELVSGWLAAKAKRLVDRGSTSRRDTIPWRNRP